MKPKQITNQDVLDAVQLFMQMIRDNEARLKKIEERLDVLSQKQAAPAVDPQLHPYYMSSDNDYDNPF